MGPYQTAVHEWLGSEAFVLRMEDDPSSFAIFAKSAFVHLFIYLLYHVPVETLAEVVVEGDVEEFVNLLDAVDAVSVDLLPELHALWIFAL